jgi:hypothetical protein
VQSSSPKKRPGSALRMYTHGTIVGIANAAVFHPFDVLRIRFFFLRKHKSGGYTQASTAAAAGINTQHIGSATSFFNGLTFNIASTAIKQMAVFPTQQIIKEWLDVKREAHNLSDLQCQFFSSIISGLVLGIVAAPISAIKVPAQASQQQIPVRTICRDIIQINGLKGFFRGGLGIILRDTSWSVTYFPVYAVVRSYIQNFVDNRAADSNMSSSSSWTTSNLRSNVSLNTSNSNNTHRGAAANIPVNLAASITAGAVGMLVSYPFDGARLYRQRHKEQFSFWHGFKKSFRLSAENLKSLATGLVRVPLSTAFCHTLYLYLQDSSGD